ncbi:MAG: conjugal transfer protein TraG [Candidatus Marinimicrobia bacterium]|nr:conjugal transfer protein TraG [Candidatus Neomarinimicrobiota bacterium]
MSVAHSPSKLLLGQIVIVFTLIIGAMWTATQWAAYSLGYQPQLGPAWFMIGDRSVYFPWRLFEWWYAYEAYAPHIFRTAGLISAAGGILSIIAAVIGSLWRARVAGAVTTYGSSRWANLSEIKSAGLFKPKGVILGKMDEQYLRHNGPEHVMAFAPTRSGKGVGLVIPTLLSWTGSVIVHDIKGENWSLTAGWRSKFSRTILFDPTNPETARYNPLLEVRRGLNEFRDVQNIADILVDPEGALEQRSHWEKTSHSLLVAAILHVLYVGEDKSLAGVVSLLSNPNQPFDETLQQMKLTCHLGDRPHPEVAGGVQEVINKTDNERSGVLSTAMTFLSLYRDPTVAHATSASDFRIRDLMFGEKPMSLYLVIPPSDLSRTKPLVRLILNQIGRRLTEKLEDDKHQLLMMLDEFPALGRLDFFESALAYMAGYGIRAFLIAQSLNQISKAYGEYNSILDNCHIRIAFASNDERTAKRISDSLGTATELRSQKNYAGHRLAPWLSHVMVSRQETARPLLTPGEVMQLPVDDELLLVSGLAPIRAKKLKYYEDRNFTERLLPAPSQAVQRAEGSGCDHDWQNHIVTSGPPTSDDEGVNFFVDESGGLEKVPELVRPPLSPKPDLDVSDSIDIDDDFSDEELLKQKRDKDLIRNAQRVFGQDQVDDDLMPLM